MQADSPDREAFFWGRCNLDYNNLEDLVWLSINHTLGFCTKTLQ
jgi:hypothetical protein